jgi:hypothetical protein
MYVRYTTNWEGLKVGGGAQGPVSQNCTSNPSNSSRVLELSRTLSNPCSPKSELNNPGLHHPTSQHQSALALPIDRNIYPESKCTDWYLGELLFVF